jgi:hypothetical protein
MLKSIKIFEYSGKKRILFVLEETNNYYSGLEITSLSILSKVEKTLFHLEQLNNMKSLNEADKKLSMKKYTTMLMKAFPKNILFKKFIKSKI